MLDEDGETGLIFSSIEDHAPNMQVELDKDTILQRKLRDTRRGKQEFLQIDVKGQNLTKAKWYRIEEVEDKFPHLLKN